MTVRERKAGTHGPPAHLPRRQNSILNHQHHEDILDRGVSLRFDPSAAHHRAHGGTGLQRRLVAGGPRTRPTSQNSNLLNAARHESPRVTLRAAAHSTATSNPKIARFRKTVPGPSPSTGQATSCESWIPVFRQLWYASLPARLLIHVVRVTPATAKELGRQVAEIKKAARTGDAGGCLDTARDLSTKRRVEGMLQMLEKGRAESPSTWQPEGRLSGSPRHPCGGIRRGRGC